MHKKGLSLMEILVSMVILTLMVASMAGLFISGKRHILHSRSRISAAELGKYFLEPLQMQVRQSDWNTNCLGTNSCPNSSITLAGIQYNVAYQITNVAAPNNRLKRVTATITW